MGHSFKTHGLLDLRDEPERAIACTAASPVGDRDETRLQRFELINRFEQIGGSFLGLRREELKGKAGVRGIETISNLHSTCRS